MMYVWLCLACVLRPTNHEPVYSIRHIGERIIRGCASAVLRDCNMIELVHAKLTHTYAATQRLSGMHVGRASVMLSVFQFFRFVCASWRREGYWIPPNTCNSGRLHNLRCASAVLRDCNMIELVHAKLTHTYAATRRLSGMHVGRASVMLSVFQFFRFVCASWRREGYWIPPNTCNSGRLHNLRWRNNVVIAFGTLSSFLT